MRKAIHRRGVRPSVLPAPYVFWYNKIKSGPPLPSCTYRTCPLSPSLPPPPSTYPRREAGQVPLRPPPPPRLQDRADGKRVLRSCQTEVGAPKIYLRESFGRWSPTNPKHIFCGRNRVCPRDPGTHCAIGIRLIINAYWLRGSK